MCVSLCVVGAATRATCEATEWQRKASIIIIQLNGRTIDRCGHHRGEGSKSTTMDDECTHSPHGQLYNCLIVLAFDFASLAITSTDLADHGNVQTFCVASVAKYNRGHLVGKAMAAVFQHLCGLTASQSINHDENIVCLRAIHLQTATIMERSSKGQKFCQNKHTTYPKGAFLGARLRSRTQTQHNLNKYRNSNESLIVPCTERV